mmetsp:Transcript_104991/g.273232  ORF Transcript_104991/g.273232 Transcript_104991/m.273232 type:complete len:453 (+) Transcript_104991:134-1492(+)
MAGRALIAHASVPDASEELSLMRAELAALRSETLQLRQRLDQFQGPQQVLIHDDLVDKRKQEADQRSMFTRRITSRFLAESDGSNSDESSETDCSKVVEITDAPESFFGYCSVMLILGPKAKVAFVTLQLIMLLLVELILSICFYDCSVRLVITDRWKPKGDHLRSACFYQGVHAHYDKSWLNAFHRIFDYRKLWRGEPWASLAVGMMCCTLLGSYFKQANMDLLANAAQVKNAGNLKALSWEHLVLHMAVHIRTIITPCAVAMGAAMQLSLSTNATEIILNAFATTFLLELDKTLYTIMLGPEEREQHLQLWADSGNIASRGRDVRAPNLILAVDVGSMMLCFLAPRLLDEIWGHGEDFQYTFGTFVQTIFVVCSCLRSSVLTASIDMRSHNENFFVHGLWGLGKSVFNVLWCYFFAIILYAVFFATDTSLPFEQFSDCLSGENQSACICE